MPEPTPQPSATVTHECIVYVRNHPLLVSCVLTTLFAAIGAAFIAAGRVPSRVFYDQELYHRPTINQFVQQWPHFDFWHYLSATTPGYHLLMAAAAKFISPSILTLQLVS